MNRHSGCLLFLLLVLLAALVPASATAAPAQQSGPALEIFSLVNQLRAEHGLPPYAYNGTLAIAAQNQANWMAANVAYSHTQDNGSTPQSRAAAVGYNGYVTEIIVGGSSMTPARGLTWWRNSSLHYSMMVSSRYSEAGAAWATNGNENMYVMVIGRPSNQPVSPQAAAAEPQTEPLLITPIELATPRADGAIVHEVAPGQALWQIAAHYDVELSHLLLINNLSEDQFLQPGDEIYVQLPAGQPPPPTPTPPLHHVVREGENPWIIAARYQVDLDTFFYLNGFDENSVLQPGEEVRFRLAPGEAPPPTPTPRLYHVVREGETLWTVAALNSLSLDELLAYNNMQADAVIHIGDQLLVRPLPTETPPPSPTALPATLTPTPAIASSPLAAAVAALDPLPTATPVPVPSPVPVPETTAPQRTFPGGSLLFAVLIITTAALFFVRGRAYQS